MKPHWITIAIALAANASAQENPDRPEHRPPPVPALFAALDQDGDGVLSPDEITTAADALATLDENGDGEITKDELRPKPPEGGDAGEHPMPPPDAPPHDRPEGPDGKRPRPPVINALDTDKDGIVSAEELDGAPKSLRTLDTNGNGQLDPEELHMPPPPREDGEGSARRPSGPPPGDDRQAQPPQDRPQGDRPQGPPPGGPRRR
jgi:Ca2+-binding EF-hand superfamily protein